MADESTTTRTAEPGDEGGPRLRGFTAGLLVGAALGIGLALLFAPERGTSTRRQLRRRLARLREQAAEGLDRAGGSARRELARRRRQLEDGIERARDSR